jgi:hypothetical protein
MDFDYSHSLSREEARTRLQALGEYLTNRHGLQVTWNGDRGSFRGKYLVVSIEGDLTIEDKQVKFRGKDPGFLWRKKAIAYMKGKLEKYLDSSTPVASLPRR